MEYAVRELYSGYDNPSPSDTGPRLRLVHTKAALSRWYDPDDPEYAVYNTASVNWAESIVLMVYTSPSGGTIALPEIASLSREGDTVTLKVGFRLNPQGEDTDDFNLPYLLAEAPAAAFAGDPEIRFEVQGQAQGTVEHER
jgi:hypothetical protein